MYADWQAASMLDLLHAGAQARGARLVLLAAGRLGDRGTALWGQVAATYRERITFLRVGEQSPEALSQLFQLLDFAIASTPWHLLGKSSSAASMLDLGLPLVVAAHPRFGFQHTEIPECWKSQVHRADETLPGKLQAALAKAIPAHSVIRVARQLVESLEPRARP